MKTLQPKSPNEAVSIQFGFGDYLAAGETISTPTLVVRALNGLDTSPSGKFSSPQVIGEEVYTLMTGGVLGEDYEVLCRVASSNSQVLENITVQPVRDIRDA